MTTLKPPSPDDPERILITGGPKVGKSSAYLTIAAKIPDANFYVLDSDRAMKRMMSTRNLTNVEVTNVDEWPDFVENTKRVGKDARPNDWLVIDFGSDAWPAVQSWYIDKRFGKTPEEYFTAHIAAAKKGNPLEGDTDWMAIKKNHQAWMSMVKKMDCNVIFTTTGRAVGDRDDPYLKMTYGTVGVRPEGEKRLTHDMHTLVVLKKSRTGEHQMTTVGDRERKLLENVPWTDFAVTYLMAVGGWRPAA